MAKENKRTMEATLRQTIEMYAEYITDDCFDNEDKKFFLEQATKCLTKLMEIQV